MSDERRRELISDAWDKLEDSRVNPTPERLAEAVMQLQKAMEDARREAGEIAHRNAGRAEELQEWATRLENLFPRAVALMSIDDVDRLIGELEVLEPGVERGHH